VGKRGTFPVYIPRGTKLGHMGEPVLPLNVLPTFPTDGGKMHTIV
jgi:hypothetical protein